MWLHGGASWLGVDARKQHQNARAGGGSTRRRRRRQLRVAGQAQLTHRQCQGQECSALIDVSGHAGPGINAASLWRRRGCIFRCTRNAPAHCSIEQLIDRFKRACGVASLPAQRQQHPAGRPGPYRACSRAQLLHIVLLWALGVRVASTMQQAGLARGASSCAASSANAAVWGPAARPIGVHTQQPSRRRAGPAARAANEPQQLQHLQQQHPAAAAPLADAQPQQQGVQLAAAAALLVTQQLGVQMRALGAWCRTHRLHELLLG